MLASPEITETSESISTMEATVTPNVQPTDTATEYQEEVAPIIGLPEDRQFLGVYDVWTKGLDLTDLDAEINYFDWEDSEGMYEFIDTSLSKQRVPVVSVEPFTTFSNNPDNLIQDTLDGLNDEVIRENVRVIKSYKEQMIQYVLLMKWSCRRVRA